MTIKKISIITLTYKNWRLLDKAIASVAGQVINKDYEIEYLVADDGTQDFDVEYVTSLLAVAGLNYRIIVNPENMGTVASFNNAIQQSTGDIIVPLSADDEFYDAHVVGDIVEEFNRTSAQVITGLRVPIVDGKEAEPLPRKKDFKLFKDSPALLKRLLVKGNIVSGASTYYRRSVFNEIGYFDTKYRLLEDYPFYIKLLTYGLDIHLMERKVIKYGVYGVSSSVGVSPILKIDYVELHAYCAANANLNFLERRYVTYTRVFNANKRLMLVWRYPEQFLIRSLLRFKCLLR